MSLIDMDPKHRLILESIQEFLDSAKNDEEKDRIKSSITMYFKAIVESCDFYIYNKILKVPDNHKERFDYLRKYDFELKDDVYGLFQIYRKTYSQKVDVADLVIIKNGTKKILEKLGIDKSLKEMAKEKGD